MVIGVTGYGFTGASACMDLLREFEDIQYYNPHIEFQVLQQPDGISDLRYGLIQNRGRIAVNTAINRFIRRYEYKRTDLLSDRTSGKYVPLSKEYIESLISVTWMGKSSYDPQDLLSWMDNYRLVNAVIKRIIHVFKPNAVWPPYKRRFYTNVTEIEFINKTKIYLENIFKASGFDITKPIMLEQLFCLENPTEGCDYFNDYRSIIVDRDPRDVFALTNGVYPKRVSAFMPNDGDVKTFVKYYDALHHSKSEDSHVFYLQYEDLIYRYDDTIQKLCNFLGLDHTAPRTHFKPEWSINNTQVFIKYPEMNDSIRYIEENLSEYIYPFEKYEGSLPFEAENVGIFDNVPGDKKIKSSSSIRS